MSTQLFLLMHGTSSKGARSGVGKVRPSNRLLT